MGFDDGLEKSRYVCGFNENVAIALLIIWPIPTDITLIRRQPF